MTALESSSRLELPALISGALWFAIRLLRCNDSESDLILPSGVQNGLPKLQDRIRPLSFLLCLRRLPAVHGRGSKSEYPFTSWRLSS